MENLSEITWFQVNDDWIQHMSEDLWRHMQPEGWKRKQKNTVLVKLYVAFLVLLAMGLLLLAIMNFLFPGEEFRTSIGNWGKLLTSYLLIVFAIRGICKIKQSQEIYGYLFFRRVIKIWMRRMDYRVGFSKDQICASICGRVFQWRWDQIEWYCTYPMTMILSIENQTIYLDLKQLKKDERGFLRENLMKTEATVREWNVKSDVYTKALKQLYQFAKR